MTENTQKKSTVLQSVKAVAVLVVICLICGALLALCNDLFFISDEEKARRAEAKINQSLAEVYPALTNPTTVKINKAFASNSLFSATVTRVVKSDDGAYVLAVDSKGGFAPSKNISVLVAIDKDAKIAGWKMTDFGGETYAGDVAAHTDWYVGEQISTDISLDGHKHGGATLTSTSLNNAIKMASFYAMNVLNLGSNPEKDANDAITALLAGTDYADYEFTANTDLAYRSALSNAENTMSYFFVGTKAGEKATLDAYVYNVDTTPQVVVLKGNLGYAARHEAVAVIAKSEGIADALVTNVQDLNYNEFKIRKFVPQFKLGEFVEVGEGLDNENSRINSVCIGDDGAYVVNVTGKQGYSGGTVTINVVIKDGAITKWNIESNEYQSFLGDHILNNWNNNVENWFIGKTVDSSPEAIAPEGSGKGTGATWSENAIARAINGACDYVKNATAQGGGN